jgi:hypothetical protein
MHRAMLTAAARGPGVIAMRRFASPHPAIDPAQQLVELVGQPIDFRAEVAPAVIGRAFLRGGDDPHAIRRHQQADPAGRQSEPFPEMCHDLSPLEW